MNQIKIGQLICALRKEKGYTQLELANKLAVSDKAVSKWERGLGAPDISLLASLAAVLEVDIDCLLRGDLNENRRKDGNMKHVSFYVCPVCGNVITATQKAAVSCCGKVLQPLAAQKPTEEHSVTIEKIEHDYYVTSDHPMEKSHSVAFVAFKTGDTLIIKKQYPEWNLAVRIPARGHGQLFWYCTEHGLFSQII